MIWVVEKYIIFIHALANILLMSLIVWPLANTNYIGKQNDLGCRKIYRNPLPN